MILFGIDPGKTGGLAAIDDKGNYAASIPMPVEGSGKSAVVDPFSIEKFFRTTLIERMVQRADARVAIERVSGFAGQGGAFSFGYSAAIPWVVARMFPLPIVFVRPTQWSVIIGTGIPKGGVARKRAVLAKARERWPDAPLAKQGDSGIADALFIAEYVRRTEKLT